MASTQAHHATGLPAGLVAAALTLDAGGSGPFYAFAILAFIFACFGSTAPDWLEIHPFKRNKRWIIHRTWTHWGVGWAGLTWYAYRMIGIEPWAPPLLGFCIGALVHLGCDTVNPRGIPWFWGTWRLSLNLWKSGQFDMIVVALSWIGALLICDQLLFSGAHMAWVAQRVSA